MLIDVVWDNDDKTILRFIRHKGWTPTDYHEAIDAAVMMLKAVPHKVHVIQDATETNEMPPNALSLFKSGNGRLAPYSATSVIVGDSTLMKALFDMFKKLNMDMADHFTFVHSLDEAYKVLADAENPPLEGSDAPL